jgi:PEP-CTERM motif
MKKISMIFILAMTMFAGVGSRPALALSISIIADTASSTEGLGNFTGVLNYNPSTARLEVQLTNTSPADNGGFITAFAFANPSSSITGVTLFEKTDPDFGLIGGPSFNGSINVAPFGDLSIGASISSSRLGKGNPQEGIAVGATETFTFQFTGTNLTQLKVENVLTLLSAGSEGFVVRFRGFENGGSDRVPAQAPEPATLLLLGSGLVGLVGLKRRSKKTN